MRYSQNGEDLIVAAQFSAPGTLLEIGAWEPKKLSNSRLLIEAGWSAVLCEFSPAPVRKLVEEYGNNPKVQIIQAAITAEEQHVECFEVTDDALSTSDPVQLAIWREKGGYFGKLWVPTVSVRALLSQFFGDRRIDFASVDTEGSSVAIAIALMRTDHRPKVLCCEHNNRIVEIMQVAQCFGYKNIHCNQENLILVR